MHLATVTLGIAVVISRTIFEVRRTLKGWFMNVVQEVVWLSCIVRADYAVVISIIAYRASHIFFTKRKGTASDRCETSWDSITSSLQHVKVIGCSSISITGERVQVHLGVTLDILLAVCFLSGRSETTTSHRFIVVSKVVENCRWTQPHGSVLLFPLLLWRSGYARSEGDSRTGVSGINDER